MGRPWPEQKADDLVQAALALQASVAGLEVLGTLRCLDRLANIGGDIAGAVIEIAAEETTITQKAMADALGVSPSMLRGLRQR